MRVYEAVNNAIVAARRSLEMGNITPHITIELEPDDWAAFRSRLNLIFTFRNGAPNDFDSIDYIGVTVKVKLQ